MKEIYETGLGIFLIVMVMTVSIAIIATSIDARNAEASFQSYVTEIEHSNFSSNVIQGVFEQAKKDGFDSIEMVLYEEQDGSTALYKRSVTSKDAVGETHRVRMVSITAKVTYSLDFLSQIKSASKQHTLRAYAR